MPTPDRRFYEGVLWPEACLPAEAIILATAIQRARTPAYSRDLQPGGQVYLDQIQSEINLWIRCGTDGVLEYQLIREGGDAFTSITVVAGEKIEGHFLRIGPNTTCSPVGFGNLPT